MPVTWNPAWAISAAKGRPTYPRPTTPTLAERTRILSFNSRAVCGDSIGFCNKGIASIRYSIKAPSLDTFYNLDWLGLNVFFDQARCLTGLNTSDPSLLARRCFACVEMLAFMGRKVGTIS